MLASVGVNVAVTGNFISVGDGGKNTENSVRLYFDEQLVRIAKNMTMIRYRNLEFCHFIADY
jgi:hypothetical protein